MKIFAIRDETDQTGQDLAYLLYYETAKQFYIELPEGADPWQTPMILSSFARKGETGVNSYWSRLWVQQRIVPPDRQNIAQVLRDNGLKEYDEFQLLMLTGGRCAQDDCYLEEISASGLPSMLSERWQTKIEDVVPLQDARLLIFFRNGEVRIADIKALSSDHVECIPYLVQEERFSTVEVQPDGYGVMWSDRAVISDRELHKHSESIPLTLDDFKGFVRRRVVSASEACQLLDCSRQNIDDLMKRDKLHPIRKDTKYKLFLRNEVLQRRRT